MTWLRSHNAASASVESTGIATLLADIAQISIEAVEYLGGEIAAAIDPSWIVATLLVLLAWYGSTLVANRLRPRLEARILRPSVTNAVLLLARVGVVLVSLIPIAGLIGFRPRNILLSVTVLSVVAGVILAPVAQSYVSGFFVVLNRPYEVGDMIELVDEETRGYVEDITLRYTKIFTLENSFLVIPNETIRERDVCNISAEDERSRLSVLVEVTYEGDLEQACEVLEASARAVDGVITGGPDIRVGSSRYRARPTAFVREFAADGIVLDLRFWVADPYLSLGIRSQVYRSIWATLQDPAVDVEVAYPHTHHVFDETSGYARTKSETHAHVAFGGPEADGIGEPERWSNANTNTTAKQRYGHSHGHTLPQDRNPPWSPHVGS